MDMISTRQARSQTTLDRIFEATETLLETHDFNALSLRRIAAAADVTTGAIYAHVENKDELLAQLFMRYGQAAEEMLVQYLREAEGAPPAEACRLFIDAIIALFSAHRGIVRTALMAVSDDPRHPMLKTIERLYERARGPIETAARTSGAKDPRLASAFAMSLVIASCREAIVLNRNARFFAFDEAVFSRELLRMMRTYLEHRE